MTDSAEKPKSKRGGYRPGAGRPAGRPNNATLRKKARIAAEVKTALEIANDVDVDNLSATDVIRMAMRTLVRAGDLQGAAAIAAVLAPYESPRIASQVYDVPLPADLAPDPKPQPDEEVPDLVE